MKKIRRASRTGVEIFEKYENNKILFIINKLTQKLGAVYLILTPFLFDEKLSSDFQPFRFSENCVS